MKKKNAKTVEVRPVAATGGWGVFLAGEKSDWSPLKRVAVSLARARALELKCELVVKNKDGRIAYRNSYGNDPRSRKG